MKPSISVDVEAESSVIRSNQDLMRTVARHSARALIYVCKATQEVFVKVPRLYVNGLRQDLESRMMAGVRVHVLTMEKPLAMKRVVVLSNVDEANEVYTRKERCRVIRLNQELRQCAATGYPRSDSRVLPVAEATSLNAEYVALTGHDHEAFVKWHGPPS